VFVGGDKTLSLGVVVPGGQEVYVAPGGALSYTQAHSVAVPAGSVRDAFSKEAPSGGNSFGYLKYGEGFVACPAGEGQGYQVFGKATGASFGSECLGFNALTCEFVRSSRVVDGLLMRRQRAVLSPVPGSTRGCEAKSF
jgi:hypothetical protein